MSRVSNLAGEAVDLALHPFATVRGITFRALRRSGLIREAEDTREDQGRDRIAPFDEAVPCDVCGGEPHPVLVAGDGSRIGECGGCGLWFTTPRIAEAAWMGHLASEAARNVEFTENRLRHGVALPANVKYSLPSWRRRRRRIHRAILGEIEAAHGGKVGWLHDVGCGVGHLLEDVRPAVSRVSGNDLNAYAVRAMRERLGLDVHAVPLSEVPIPPESLDAVVMRDYLEHTYHPFADLVATRRLLRPGGVLWIETFHVDSDKFERLGAGWNMLSWNHTHHWSRPTLRNALVRAGLEPIELRTKPGGVLVTTARKS